MNENRNEDESRMQSQITILLSQIREGKSGAKDKLYTVVYSELRKIASQLMRFESPAQSFSASDIVHEAYIRLCDQDVTGKATNRRFFFASAARAMRQILVDRARMRKAQKRGGELQQQPLDSICQGLESAWGHNILELDEALNQMQNEKPRQYQVIMYRFFGGFTIEATAHILGLSESTIEGDWRLARSHLYRELSDNTE